VVYLATVAEVRETTPADPATGSPARMSATFVPTRIFRPTPPPSPAPATLTVRYEQAGKADDEAPATMAYRLAVGDRVLVFAPSFDPAFPIELVPGPAKTVAAQVAALKAALVKMDDTAARLHGVTPSLKAQQSALYDRVLADLGASRAR
jgi:hypothetical protein